MKYLSALFLSLSMFVANATTTTNFNAWSMICGQQGNCSLSQLVATDPEAKKIIMGVNVNFSMSNDFPVLMLRLPPSIDKNSGVGIKIDDNKALQLPISQCNKKACQSVIKMDEALLNEMRQGNVAKVAILLKSKKQLTMPVSMQGFKEAYSALLEHQKS